MSYILNALKKSEQERGGDSSANTRSDAPRALERPLPDTSVNHSNTLFVIGGVSAVAAIAVAVWVAGPWFASTDTTVIATGEPATATAAAFPAQSVSNQQTPDINASSASQDTRTPPGPVVSAMAEPTASIMNQQPVNEPSAGGRMPVQRTPRPVSTVPEISAPLVTPDLAPPMLVPTRNNVTETSTNPSAAVEVSQIPPPPTASPGEPETAIDSDIAAPVEVPTSGMRTVRITPNIEELEPRREVVALAPIQADASSLSEAADLHEKGWAFERSGDFALALDTFSRAIELRPDFADAYYGRAWVRDRLDQLEQATKDYGNAIRVEPKFAAAYGSRGVARFYLDELSAAEKDFEQTLQLGRGELRRFAVLWRYLSAEHDGRDGAGQLVADTQNVNLDRWPGVIARFYLDAVDAETVLADTGDPDPNVTRERLCVAYFFIAQKHLLDGSAAKARENFQKALDTGVTEFIQYKAAQRELDRIATLR